jgi:hypothetical protein
MKRDARNEYLVKMFPKKAQLNARARRLQKRIDALSRQLKDLKRITDELSDVDAVVDGVAVQILGERVFASSHTLNRGAEIYKAQGDHAKGYGLHTFNTFGRKDERWAGTGWKKKDAQAAAMLWVTKGIRPVQK